MSQSPQDAERHFSDQTIDAYQPSAIAQRVELAGVAKARLGMMQTLMLSILAGAFIAFGAMLYTVAITDSAIGLGPERLIGGVAFSLGLVLVVIAGAELFTGNSLIVIAWADRRITFDELMRNWTLVYLGNLIGAVATAVLVFFSGTLAMEEGAFASSALAIAEGKVQISYLQAFVRGILCNVLVCLAIWLSYAARAVAGKIFAIMFPVCGFVALGFEHSIANMYFIPLGMMLGDTITIEQLVGNLFPVTIGNVIGGGVFVGLVYWIAYRAAPKAKPET